MEINNLKQQREKSINYRVAEVTKANLRIIFYSRMKVSLHQLMGHGQVT